MAADLSIMQDSLPVLDRAILQTLRSVGGSDALFQRVAKLFLSQAPVVAGNVVQLSDSRDLAASPMPSMD